MAIDKLHHAVRPNSVQSRSDRRPKPKPKRKRGRNKKADNGQIDEFA